MKWFSESLSKLWHHWGIRGLVIISILAQFILEMYGNKRKSKQYWFRSSFIREQLLWCAYIVSNWLPGFAVGVISDKLGKLYCDCSCEDVANASLMALWATLFLVQLGGPDNITAYALEDNELWQTHVLRLVAQTSVTAYVVVSSWDTQSPFSRLSILMLIVGFIKYGERVWALYSASFKHRSSTVNHLDDHDDENSILLAENGNDDEQRSDPKAMLRRFKFLFISFFTDVVLSTRRIERDRLHFQGISFEEAFDVVRTELGLAYDVFYTKALVRYGTWGFISPLITFTGAGVLYIYCRAYIGNVAGISQVDAIFTYLLAIVVAFSEGKSALYLALSSYTSDRLGARVTGLRRLLLRVRRHVRGFKKETEQKPLIIQYDFLTLCKKNDKCPTKSCDLDISCKFKNANHCSDLTGLMEIIFDNLRSKSVAFTPSNNPNFRDHILGYERPIGWASELEFQRCIVLWHIATDICYYSDEIGEEEEDRVHAQKSKNLSDYMFYLLLECRYMLPVGSGLVTLQETCYEAINFLRCEGVLESDADNAYQRLLQFQPRQGVRVDQSLLSSACKLARELLERHDGNRRKWIFLG